MLIKKRKFQFKAHMCLVSCSKNSGPFDVQIVQFSNKHWLIELCHCFLSDFGQLVASCQQIKNASSSCFFTDLKLVFSAR